MSGRRHGQARAAGYAAGGDGEGPAFTVLQSRPYRLYSIGSRLRSSRTDPRPARGYGLPLREDSSAWERPHDGFART